MRVLVLLSLLCVGVHASSKDITYQQFKQLDRHLLEYLVNEDKLQDFEYSQMFENNYDTPVVTIILKAHAADSDQICFFGGWPSLKDRAGKCYAPWKVQRRSFIKDHFPSNTYSKENYCGSKYKFRCNPTLFPGESKKGECVNYRPLKTLTKRCVETSTPRTQWLKHIYQNADKKQAYLEIVNHIYKNCKVSKKLTCKQLMIALDNINHHHCLGDSQQGCKSEESLLRQLPLKEASFEKVALPDATYVAPPELKIESKEKKFKKIDDKNSINEENLSTQQRLEKNFLKLGGDIKALKHAQCFKNEHRKKVFDSGSNHEVSIADNCVIGINDYTKSSDHKRFFLVNTCDGSVKVMHSAHGRGKGSQTNGKSADYISNKYNSNQSPSGFFVMGDTYAYYDRNGKPLKTWYPGIRMHGLEYNKKNPKLGNHNSYGRGIVMHRTLNSSGKPYCSEEIVTSDDESPDLKGGNCGRTHGCLGVGVKTWPEMITNMKGERTSKTIIGPLLYNYSKLEKSYPENYCGANLWLK